MMEAFETAYKKRRTKNGKRAERKRKSFTGGCPPMNGL